ncbi:MAG: hypothetical protein ACM3XM_20920 [Mycobacterium leprae]
MKDETAEAVATAIGTATARFQVEGFNFSTVPLPKRTNHPEWTIKGGTSIAVPNVEATRLLVSAAVGNAVSLGRTRFLALYQVRNSPHKLVAVPVSKAGENTVTVSWSPDTTSAHISLRKLFMVRSFTIGDRTRAHIPVTLESHTTLGSCLLLHLDQISTTPIAARPRRAPNSRTE